jgi:ADP-heptose:LPS heptosyltransferase
LYFFAFIFNSIHFHRDFFFNFIFQVILHRNFLKFWQQLTDSNYSMFWKIQGGTLKFCIFLNLFSIPYISIEIFFLISFSRSLHRNFLKFWQQLTDSNYSMFWKIQGGTLKFCIFLNLFSIPYIFIENFFFNFIFQVILHRNFLKFWQQLNFVFFSICFQFHAISLSYFFLGF